LGNKADPAVAVDCDGNAYAVWATHIGSGSVIHSSMLPFGGSWTDVVTLSDPAVFSDFADIAVSPCGNAVSVWLEKPAVDSDNATVQSASWTGVPCAPKKFHANVYRHHHGDKYWRLHSWFKAPEEFGDIAYYEIHQKGKHKPIAIIRANEAHKFRKFLHTSGHLYKRYSVVAVSQDFLRSDPVHLELMHRRDHQR
jgi:hypothetical protein